MNVACEGYEALLEDRLAGELGGEGAKKLADHLAGCPACRTALAEAEASARLLKAGTALEREPDAGFAHRVMARLDAFEEFNPRAGFWLPFVPMAWRFAAGATVALAFLLAYPATWRQPAPVSVAAVDQAQMRDLFSPDPAGVPADPNQVFMMVMETNHGTD
jgi:anti-sigma factor RsiW